MLARLFARTIEVSAHCDLPCGVYDPAQARIEAQSVKAICEKLQGNNDPDFRTRALLIKEQRAELVKHHLWVLWTDYFKPRTSRSIPICIGCSTRPPSLPAAVQAAPSPPTTQLWPTICSPRSTKSPRSSPRPRLLDPAVGFVTGAPPPRPTGRRGASVLTGRRGDRDVQRPRRASCAGVGAVRLGPADGYCWPGRAAGLHRRRHRGPAHRGRRGVRGVAPLADADALTARFDLEPGSLQVAVSVPSDATEPPSRNTFAWTVLTALAGDVDASVDDGRVTLTLRKTLAVNPG